MSARSALEGESEAIGLAMPYRKAANRKLSGINDLTLRQWNELQRDRRFSFAPQPGEHPDHDIEGAGATMNGHHTGVPSQPQRRKKTGNAEHVVEMTVGQQERIQPPKAGAAAQQLTLDALSAIHQNSLATRL